MIPKTPDETIAAIATPRGQGAIGIVRLSGPHALTIVGDLFHSPNGRDPRTDRGRVFYGEIREGDAHVDEVLVHVMRAPHSYTREDIVEINAHGGAVPLEAILDLVLRHGARLAQPGEFTKRAFLNGRLDLAQAEAVLDRIEAQTRAGLQAAASAASGTLSRSIENFADKLRDAKAHFEAAIDFSEQDIPEAVDPAVKISLEGLLKEMEVLRDTAHLGRLIREGTSIAIAGKPNVGKSSLFNALVRDARAIVTPHAGTTRDPIEETISLEGIAVRLTDTAGIRQTSDEVETLGVEAARKALAASAIILFVVDGSRAPTEEDHVLAEECRQYAVPIVLVANKADIAKPNLDLWNGKFAQKLSVSAITGEGLPTLEEKLGRLILEGAPSDYEQAMLTRTHQKESLQNALNALRNLLENFEASPELLALDLNDALRALGEITGETTPDDVLERIFNAFCIGK